MLNRIQKQFVRLAITHKANWMSMPPQPYRRRRVKKWAPSQTKVKIINAVTGEETIAKAYDDTPTTLKRWLKMRNVRAQFADMLIKKGSTWSLITAEDMKDYPVIVKVGHSKYPYVIDHMGDYLTIAKKTTATVFLRTVDNINYLGIIDQKKALLPKSPVKVFKRKTKKKKK